MGTHSSIHIQQSIRLGTLVPESVVVIFIFLFLSLFGINSQLIFYYLKSQQETSFEIGMFNYCKIISIITEQSKLNPSTM